jgi:thioester reductase-like protein
VIGMDGPILLTGATGFLGMELLLRLLERTDRPIIALVRASDDAAASARLDSVLATLFPPDMIPTGRVRAVAADLQAPSLGRTAKACAALADDIDTVVHCAASVQFSLPIDEARAINVEGTRRVLALAANAPKLDRIVHVSTAYVAGDRPGRYHEHEADIGQRPRNTYEQTKLEAERLITDSELPAAILRPSIVVGDSRTGWTPAFNVIYWPLQAFARGLFPCVPADPDARADIVPVDAVADALHELTVGTRRTGTYHVVAGEDAVTTSELVALAADAFGQSRPTFVAPGAAPEAEDRAGAYLPYFRVRGTFDATLGHALGFHAPALRTYFGALMRYASQARWGKRPHARWQLAPGAQ